MTWRERLREGSFRGVPVHTARRAGSGGKRLQVDSIPGEDDPVVQEFGLAPRRFTYECYVLGADYDQQRDRVLEAVEEKGTATLVDFWRGEIEVWVETYAYEESKEDGGYCRFTLQLLKAGVEARPRGAADTRALSVTAADGLAAAAEEAFELAYNVSRWPSFVAGEAAGWLSDFTGLAAGLQTVDRFAEAAGSLVTARSRFAAELEALAADPLGIVRGAGLASRLLGLTDLYRLATGGGRGSVSGLRDLGRIGEARPALPGGTPSRMQAQANETALTRLAARASIASRVRAAAATGFESYDEARELRQKLIEEIDAEVLQAGDAGERGVYAALMTVKARAGEDLIARGGSLARLKAYETHQPLPALALAYRLYGDAGRAGELARRNRAVHPGFMPVRGQSLAE